MSNTESLRLTLTMLVCPAIVALAGPVRAAEGEPEGVKTFKKTVEAQAKTILRASHPLGKYKGIAFDGYQRTGQKHVLTYTVKWLGKEDKQEKEFATTFTFTARFDKDGEIDELEVAVPKDTSPSRAFRGADVAAGVFRAQVKRKVTAVTDDKELLDRIDKMDGDGLLAAWIKYVDRKPKK